MIHFPTLCHSHWCIHCLITHVLATVNKINCELLTWKGILPKMMADHWSVNCRIDLCCNLWLAYAQQLRAAKIRASHQVRRRVVVNWRIIRQRNSVETIVWVFHQDGKMQSGIENFILFTIWMNSTNKWSRWIKCAIAFICHSPEIMQAKQLLRKRSAYWE